MSLLDQFSNGRPRRRRDRIRTRASAAGIAWGLADAGCDVVLNARRQADLDVTAAGVEERGRRALVFAADIRDRSEELADLTMAEFGRLDIWVNNVGGSDEKKTRALVDTPDEIFRAQLELNLTTAFQGAKAAAKRMPDGGSIINIASGAGYARFTLHRAVRSRQGRHVEHDRDPLVGARPAEDPMQRRLARVPSPPRRSPRCSGPQGAEEAIAATIPLGFLGTRLMTSLRPCCTWPARRPSGSPAATSWPQEAARNAAISTPPPEDD